jgi:hypothetical protein
VTILSGWFGTRSVKLHSNCAAIGNPSDSARGQFLPYIWGSGGAEHLACFYAPLEGVGKASTKPFFDAGDGLSSFSSCSAEL